MRTVKKKIKQDNPLTFIEKMALIMDDDTMPIGQRLAAAEKLLAFLDETGQTDVEKHEKT